MAITVEVAPIISEKVVERFIVRDELARMQAKMRPHGKVIDGVEHLCSCGDATAVHDISLPGEVTE